MAKEVATLGGGCFWCLEAVYQDVKGVESVVSGYAGGSTPNPTYRDIGTGRTGHAEVVQVTYDNDIISFDDLLNIFFTIHDPTTLNRQGADIGSQYRSVVLAHDDGQKAAVEAKIRELESAGVWSNIVTEVALLDRFYRAEDYHQNYYRDNPNAGYCQVIIAPKVAKFRKMYVDKLRV